MRKYVIVTQIHSLDFKSIIEVIFNSLLYLTILGEVNSILLYFNVSYILYGRKIKPINFY